MPPLASAALRGMSQHAVKLDSGSRRSLLPGLGAGLPGLRSSLSGMRYCLPGLRTDLPGSSAPLSGQHVPPLREQSGLLLRGQDGRQLEINFSTHNAGVQQDAVAPHSTTADHRTAQASDPARCVKRPLGRPPCGTWALSSCGASEPDCRARYSIRFARASR